MYNIYWELADVFVAVVVVIVVVFVAVAVVTAAGVSECINRYVTRVGQSAINIRLYI
jgi:hypothetical protein